MFFKESMIWLQKRFTSINYTLFPAYKSPCSALSKTPDWRSQQTSFGSTKRVSWWTGAPRFKTTDRSPLILVRENLIPCFSPPTDSLQDSIWPLITVFDWAIGVIARAMREAILVGASAEWQGSDDSLMIGESNLHPSPLPLLTHIPDPCSPLLLLLHPILRSLVLRLLSQFHQLSIFLSTLERPILQPESKTLPASNTRDPMATVVAREQIRDIPLRQGVDVEQWGRALESCKIHTSPPN